MRRVACAFAALALAAWLAVYAAPADNFHFVLLGDRTGEVQPGIYERVWKELAASQPAFVLSPGDTIQGLNDATAESRVARSAAHRRTLPPHTALPRARQSRHMVRSFGAPLPPRTPSTRPTTASITAALTSPSWTTAARMPGRRVNWPGSKTISASILPTKSSSSYRTGRRGCSTPRSATPAPRCTPWPNATASAASSPDTCIS